MAFFLKVKYHVDTEGKVVDVVARLNREQLAEFEAEIQSRLKIVAEIQSRLKMV